VPPLSAQNRLISGRREVPGHRRESERPGFVRRFFSFLFLSFFAFKALPEPALRLKRRVPSENQNGGCQLSFKGNHQMSPDSPDFFFSFIRAKAPALDAKPAGKVPKFQIRTGFAASSRRFRQKPPRFSVSEGGNGGRKPPSPAHSAGRALETGFRRPSSR
jgi:hypothetical protein